MDHKIEITESENKVALKLSSNITFPLALQMLSTTILQLAKQSIQAITNEKKRIALQNNETVPEELESMISEEIASMCNYAFTNILNTLFPRDPNLELSEVAIATMENEIIHKAAAEHKTLQEALKEYEANLLATSEHPCLKR